MQYTTIIHCCNIFFQFSNIFFTNVKSYDIFVVLLLNANSSNFSANYENKFGMQWECGDLSGFICDLVYVGLKPYAIIGSPFRALDVIPPHPDPLPRRGEEDFLGQLVTPD